MNGIGEGKYEGLGIASMVLGISSFIFGWILIGIPMSILAITFALIVLKNRREVSEKTRSRAKLGLISGIFGLLVSLVVTFVLVLVGIYVVNEIEEIDQKIDEEIEDRVSEAVDRELADR